MDNDVSGNKLTNYLFQKLLFITAYSVFGKKGSFYKLENLFTGLRNL